MRISFPQHMNTCAQFVRESLLFFCFALFFSLHFMNSRGNRMRGEEIRAQNERGFRFCIPLLVPSSSLVLHSLTGIFGTQCIFVLQNMSSIHLCLDLSFGVCVFLRMFSSYEYNKERRENKTRQTDEEKGWQGKQAQVSCYNTFWSTLFCFSHTLFPSLFDQRRKLLWKAVLVSSLM